MMKMPMFLKAIKVVVVNSLIFALLQNPFITNAMAAEKSGIDSQDILKIANGAVDLYGKYLGQKQQIISAQIASVKNQQLMSQLSPNCRKPDGTACYVTPAKYFPECNLPASMTNMPQNACNANAQDPNAIATMITYESIAKGWKNYYEQMANRNSNASYPTGLRCLLDKQKAIDSQLTEMMNNLQRLQDKMNQDKRTFLINNNKLLAEMSTTNDELFGSSKNNLALKTRDFAKYFSQSCQAVLGKELANGSAKGLSGMLQGLSTPNKSAADFLSNKGSIESDIRREADKITNSIKTNGIDDFNELFRGNKLAPENNATFGIYGASMMNQVAKNVSEFEVAKNRIKKDLSGIKKYELPALDSRFSPNMEEFLAGANETFKQQFISDCVTGADKGIALPVDDILRSLEQRATNSEGTARDDYRIALKAILNSGNSPESILEQIKTLDKNYPGMTVTYKDANQNRVIETPYSLFMKTAERCEQSYVQRDSGKVERAKAALAELKTLNDSFASKVSSSVLNQLLTCNGSSMKSGTCNEEALSGGQSNPNFCVSHASQCASEIQGCYAEVDNHVQTRKAKMETLAKKFNDNVAAMIAASNALYESQKAAVTNMTKLIQQRFPGTNFDIPKDMFVTMPELKKDAFGIDLAGDGKIESFLEGPTSMPEKITLLKKMFELQRSKVKEELNDYISGQEQAMKDNAGKWETFAGECKNAIDGASNALAKANNEGMKRQGEIDNLVAKYCDKYADLKENPNGACDEAKKLTDIMEKIIDKGGNGRIAGQASKITAQYNSACKATNNEGVEVPPKCTDDEDKDAATKAYCKQKMKEYTKSSKTSNESGADSRVPLSKLCQDGTQNSEFLSKIAQRFSPESKEKLKDVTSLSDALKKSDSLSNKETLILENLEGLMSTKDANICGTLKGIYSSKDQRDYDGEKSAAQDSLNDLLAQLKKEKEAKPENGVAVDVSATEAKIRAKRAEIAKIEKEKSSKDAPKIALNKVLADIATLNAATDPKTEDGLKARLTSLGQKQEEDSSCDAQNSTGTMAKSNLPWMTDPSSLDSKILGNNSSR